MYVDGVLFFRGNRDAKLKSVYAVESVYTGSALATNPPSSAI